jgi:hypothetical protein
MTWGEPVIYQPLSVDELQNMATRSRGNHRGTVETLQRLTGNGRVGRVETQDLKRVLSNQRNFQVRPGQNCRRSEPIERNNLIN